MLDKNRYYVGAVGYVYSYGAYESSLMGEDVIDERIYVERQQVDNIQDEAV